MADNPVATVVTIGLYRVEGETLGHAFDIAPWVELLRARERGRMLYEAAESLRETALGVHPDSATMPGAALLSIVKPDGE